MFIIVTIFLTISSYNNLIFKIKNKMSKKLTHEFISLRTKCDRLEKIKSLNLWGNDIDDVTILKQMANLEVVSLSVNNIKTLKDFSSLKYLKELYIRKNFISDMSEVNFLVGCKNLKVLWLGENPISENKNYRKYVIKTLPQINKLDDQLITDEERAPDVLEFPEQETNKLNVSLHKENSWHNDSLVKSYSLHNSEVYSNNVSRLINSEDENQDNVSDNFIIEDFKSSNSSINQAGIYSNNDKRRKMKDKFPSNLYRSKSHNKIDDINFTKNNDNTKLEYNHNRELDGNRSQNYKFEKNSTAQFNYNPSGLYDETPPGQIKNSKYERSSTNYNQFESKNSYYNNDNNYIPPQNRKSKITMKKSHNILSSVLLLIQELNNNDLYTLNDEINKMLR